MSAIRDLATFRRFLALLASRCGQILNKTDLAAPLGVSVPTLTQWLGILEITGQILLVPPFFENFGKRLLKSPRLYFVDSGLACHLLGIESARILERSAFLGAIFEGFVAAEILKLQLSAGTSRGLYYFRDQQGLEVDFVVPQGHKKLLLLEAKASRTPAPAMAGPLRRLAQAAQRYSTRRVVVHRAAVGGTTRAFAPGVQAMTLEALLADLEA